MYLLTLQHTHTHIHTLPSSFLSKRQSSFQRNTRTLLPMRVFIYVARNVVFSWKLENFPRCTRTWPARKRKHRATMARHDILSIDVVCLVNRSIYMWQWLPWILIYCGMNIHNVCMEGRVWCGVIWVFDIFHGGRANNGDEKWWGRCPDVKHERWEARVDR